MKNKILNIVKELIPYIIIIIVVCLIRTYIITPVRVDGTSMNPTLENDEILLLNKYDHSYKRFDIIVFKTSGSKLVKRIIGLPGDTVEYKNNKLYINGNYVEENFSHKTTNDFKEEKVKEGYYFVLGDNRTNSLDSRFIGQIPKENITGVVKISLYPPKILK